MPKFTKVGFEKISIPPDVYAMLLWEYQRQKATMYEEPPPTAIINCKKISEMENKKQSSLKNMGRTFLTRLRFDLLLKMSNVDKGL